MKTKTVVHLLWMVNDIGIWLHPLYGQHLKDSKRKKWISKKCGFSKMGLPTTLHVSQWRCFVKNSLITWHQSEVTKIDLTRHVTSPRVIFFMGIYEVTSICKQSERSSSVKGGNQASNWRNRQRDVRESDH